MNVIVSGASISGLFTAYLLAKEGVKVEVYEKEGLLGRPPRTLIVTSELNNVLGFLPEEIVLNKVNYIELFSRTTSTTIELKTPDLIIEREKMVNYLAHLAKGVGVEIVLRHQCEGFALFGKKVTARIRDLDSNKEFQKSVDILIGADGAQSRINLVASRNGHLLTTLLQARVHLPMGQNPNTVRVWFDSDRTKYFYWLIPESERVAAVGLVAEDIQQAEECLLKFLRERGLEAFEFQSAMVPMHRFGFIGEVLSKEHNVFTVGDAAAQVKVTTVGGVVTGLHGARALSYAILNGRNYSKALRELKIELNLHFLIRQILNRFSGEDYDRLIGMINGRLKNTLEEWNRDELKQSFLKLMWAEPRLIKLGAKALIRSLL